MKHRPAPADTRSVPFRGGHVQIATRAAVEGAFAPATAQDETRTVEVTWTTGAAVRRWDYVEELLVSEEAVDLTRLNGGASVLNTHSQYDLKDVLGVVERAWIDTEGGIAVGKAVLRLSMRDEVTPLWNDIKAGIVRHVSVGYSIDEYEIIDMPEQLPVLRVTRWTPSELSFVPVPADAGAGTRSAPKPTGGDHAPGRVTIPETTKQGVHMTKRVRAEKKDHQAAVRQAVEFERVRAEGIREAVSAAGLEASVADEYVRKGTSLNAVRNEVLKALAQKSEASQVRSQNSNTKIEVKHDEAETRRAGITEALLHRHAPGKYKLEGPGADWRGMSMLEIARAVLEENGERTRGLQPIEIAQRALIGTGDLPHVFGQVARRTLRDAYGAVPATYTPIIRETTATDFRPMDRVAITGAPKLLEVSEHGEYERAKLGDSAETYRVKKFGRIVGVSWEAIVNDDLNALARLPEMFGRAAADNISDLVWGILISNPVMSDGFRLFSAEHGNLLAGAGIGEAGIAAAEQALGDQTTAEGTALNLMLATVCVPFARKLQAQKLLSSVNAGKSADVNVYQNAFDLVIEGRLKAENSPWFAAASTAQADIIELAYLGGNQGISFAERTGFEVDGWEMKITQVAGAAPIDFRGIVKNPGHASQ